MSIVDTSPASPTLSLAVLEAEKRRLTRLAKNSAVVRSLSLSGQVHTDLLRIREQIKQAKAVSQ